MCVVLCSAAAMLFECSLPTDITPQMLLFVVGGISFLLVTLAGVRHLRNIKCSTIWKSALLAVLLALQMTLEWDDCTYLAPAVVSAYGAFQVLFVPLLMRFLGKRISGDQLVGILFVVAGVFLMRGLFYSPESLMYQGHHNVYEPLLSSLAMSVLIVATSLVVKKEDPIAVTALQFFFVTLIGGGWYLFDQGVFKMQDFAGEVYGQLFVVAFFGSALMFFLNNVAQRYADVTDVAIMTSLEPFALLLMSAYLPALHFSNDIMTADSFVGACLVGVGAVVSAQFLVTRVFKAIKKEPVGQLLAEIDSTSDGAAEVTQVTETKASSVAMDPVLKFTVVMVVFMAACIPFKLLEIIPGVTELRPANAIPYLAGMIGGLPGAAACAVGNLGSDFFGTLSVHSLAGAVANFFAAWIPFRIWYVLRDETPNVKTVKNLAIAAVSCVVAGAVVALIIGFSYDIGQTGIAPDVTKAVFVNQLVFSALLGVPIMAILLVDLGFEPSRPRRNIVLSFAVEKLEGQISQKKLVRVALLGFVVFSLLAVAFAGMGWSYLSPPVFFSGLISFCLFVLLCI